MKLIKLNGKAGVGKFAKVDDEDYELVNKYKWRAHQMGNTIYAETGRFGMGTFTHLRMHRLIMNVINPKILIDHKDGDGLNCQRNNLRVCSRAQNSQNRKAWGTSKYLGVSWNKKEQKWISQISINGKIKKIGRFKIEQEAAAAYNEYALLHHKEFARLNLI